MAIYNEILVPRFARALQKLFGTKGTVPTKQLSGEVIAVHTFGLPENRYVEGWERFGAVVQQVASVGNASAIRFTNPAASNIIAVIEKLMFFQQGADAPTLQYNAPFGAYAGATGGSSIDLRGRPISMCLVSSAAPNVSIGGGFGKVNLAVGPSMYDWILTDDEEIAVTPGTSLNIFSSVVNQALTINFVWRERFLEEPERF